MKASSSDLVIAPISSDEWKNFSTLLTKLQRVDRTDLYLPVARLQLHYLLHSPEFQPRTAEIAIRARRVAFNIASFTWPGWGDLGVISHQNQELGRSAAKYALELEEQYDKPTMEVLWMNGAHELNVRNYDCAREFFVQAEGAVDNEELKCMPRTWFALTEYIYDPVDLNKENLNYSLEQLRTKDQKNGEFYAEQVTTALKVYKIS